MSDNFDPYKYPVTLRARAYTLLQTMSEPEAIDALVQGDEIDGPMDRHEAAQLVERYPVPLGGWG